MKLARLGSTGNEAPVVITADGTFDLSSITADLDGAFFERGGIDEVRAAIAAGSLEPSDLILTGTPAGVALSGRFPYLTAGDVVDLEIEGLGHQTQEFVDSGRAI